MKVFIKNITIFFLPILLLSWPLDILISNFISERSSIDFGADEYTVWNDIYGGKLDTDIAIYGSSRAWTQIDPSIIKDNLGYSTYNFGVDGHNFSIQLLRHYLYQKYNKKPKLIILSVDFTTFQKRADLYNYYQFLPYMLWDDTIQEYTTDYVGFNKLDYIFPLIRYAGELGLIKNIYKFENQQNIVNRENGFRAHSIAWNDDLDKALAEKPIKAELGEKLILLFKDFLSECREKNINVLMVHTPMHIAGQKFVENNQEANNLIANIAKEYNLEFLDYSKSEICLDKTYFYNSMHMNKKGVNKFTVQLINDIKSTNTYLQLNK